MTAPLQERHVYEIEGKCDKDRESPQFIVGSFVLYKAALCSGSISSTFTRLTLIPSYRNPVTSEIFVPGGLEYIHRSVIAILAIGIPASIKPNTDGRIFIKHLGPVSMIVLRDEGEQIDRWRSQIWRAGVLMAS